MSLIVHIGSPKTATSTLQNAFFPHHDGVYFLGKEVDEKRGWTGWRTPEIQTLMLNLERTNLEFKPNLDAVNRLVENIKSEAQGRPVVISSEDLCGFSGIESIKKLKRIETLFGSLGPIKIILAVREQLSLWKSIYITEHRGEMMQIPGTQQTWYPTFDQYLDIQARYVWGAALESFRYAVMIEQYEAMVGRENVFVYSFDDFRRDQVAVLRSLCRFIGINDSDTSLQQTAVTRENQHYSGRGYAFIRWRPYVSWVRRFVPAWIKDAFYRWLNRGAPFDFEPSTDAVRRVKDYYRADNEALFKSRGIRL